VKCGIARPDPGFANFIYLELVLDKIDKKGNSCEED
jgi:hypothetical protein